MLNLSLKKEPLAEEVICCLVQFVFAVLCVGTSWVCFEASDGGIVVSIAAFQAVDPGSIPGHRKPLIFTG